MKKIFSVAVVIGTLLISCQKTNTSDTAMPATSTTPQITDRTCASSDILAAQLAANPQLKARREAIEVYTRRVMAANAANKTIINITIPVVVNVVYNTPAENISIEQIQSQIDVLNEDFNRQNKDVTSVPSIYKRLIGDAGIH